MQLLVWSSWALLPMVAVLVWRGSALWLLYAAAALTAFLYHWHREQRFIVLDHLLAWACIVANLWLAVSACDWRYPVAAIICIIFAIDRYYAAHAGDDADYCRHHTVWHLWCGVGGLLLALGYRV